MKFNKLFLQIATVAALSLFSACGGSSPTSSECESGSTGPSSIGPTLSGTNVLPINLADNVTNAANGYVNEPLVTISLCTVGGVCQTIPNVLLDTGSYGLRIFKSLVTLSLTQETDPGNGGKAVAECAQFGSGNEWGPVVIAKVGLGNETPVQVPVHLVDSTYATVPTNCTAPDTSPSQAGYNGILGVGLLDNDCPDCVASASLGVYFDCTGTTCTSVTMPAPLQVKNPVPHLAQDNNGVTVILPAVPSCGASQVAGALVLGIGTTSGNNTPSASAQRFAATSTGLFDTTFAGQNYIDSIIDSGSNGLFFPSASGLSNCNDFFCSSGTQNFSAVMAGNSGSPRATVSFSIQSASDLFGTKNVAFSTLGGANSTFFDWGLPFFFGRTVHVGVTGTSSIAFGSGPYWAF